MNIYFFQLSSSLRGLKLKKFLFIQLQSLWIKKSLKYYILFFDIDQGLTWSKIFLNFKQIYIYIYYFL